MAYSDGTIPAMAVQWEWWLLTNSLAWYGLLAIVVASILTFHFFGEKS
jgi:hypothetical protein